MSRNTKPLPFFLPSIGHAEIRAVKKVMKSGWLTTGPQAAAFEKEFAALINSSLPQGKPFVQALAVNSATSGLHLSLEAAGITRDSLVAVPSMTFTATAEILRYLGAHPVFIDSDPQTGNMSPDSLAAACSRHAAAGKKIQAVIPVHMAGRPCNMNELRQAMNGEDCFFIEDAAHALPSCTPQGMAGSLGDAGVFSFYATKTMTTGEGGMIISSNTQWLERMRIMRLHGIDREVWNRYRSTSGHKAWEYDVAAPGYKYNMTDMAAALGRVQLKRYDKLYARRRELASQYNHLLGNLDGITTPHDEEAHAWHLYIIRFDDPAKRDRTAEELSKKNIGCSVHFIPLHRMSYWRNQYKLNPKNYPGTEYLADRILSLPLWPGMPLHGLKLTVSIVRSVLNA